MSVLFCSVQMKRSRPVTGISLALTFPLISAPLFGFLGGEAASMVFS